MIYGPLSMVQQYTHTTGYNDTNYLIVFVIIELGKLITTIILHGSELLI